MANSDYTQLVGTYGFCPTATIAAGVPLQTTATVVSISGLSASFPNPIRNGMGAMINNEIVIVQSFSGSTLTLLRGCADTIPQAHAPGSRIWFIEDSMTRVPVEYASTTSVSVKPLARTSSAVVSIASAPPLGVVMNSRFARPYPPGNVQANGQRWDASGLTINAAGALTLTWAHRNRVTQADLLVPHTESSISPEVGQTYRITVYRASDNAPLSAYNTSGTSFTYTGGQATVDFGAPGAPAAGYLVLESRRDGLASLMNYRINFTAQPTVVAQQSFSAAYVLETRPSAAVTANYTIT